MERFQKGQQQEKGGGGVASAVVGRLRNSLGRSLEPFLQRAIKGAELLFVPRDLVTCDPSLIDEIQKGQFGLDGIFLELDEGGCIFDAPFADDGFNRVLHGFGWLRDLGAAKQEEATEEAHRLVFGWIDRFGGKYDAVIYQPEVIARRVMSFLTNEPLITDGVGDKRKRKYLRSLCEQVAILRGMLKEVDAGQGRLHVLVALTTASLCLSKHESLLREVTPLLITELDRQILEDGGHMSRNPEALLDLLFELIPLWQAYEERGVEPPEGLGRAVERMLPMIRFFRMGDSSLARFNGQNATPTDALATLLAHDKRKRKPPMLAAQSGYCRLEEGPAIVLADVGVPPPGKAARTAHAGCLSFELSVRHFALVVNSGGYRGEDQTWRRYARSTAAHSTLSIDSHSQGGFDASGALQGPAVAVVEHVGPGELLASHKGYHRQFGLVHQRRLKLREDGLQLRGSDRLLGVETRPGLVCSIRFHLHPMIEIAPSDGYNFYLALPDGEVWRFNATGALKEMAESVYLAYRRGREPAHQIVLAADACNGLIIDWVFEQVKPRPIVM